MMTNIVVSIIVTIVTNTTETLPKHMVSDPPAMGQEIYAVYYGHEVDDDNPKEKWITTNIVEVTTVRFNVIGKQYEVKSENCITNWTTHYVLAEPEKPKWDVDAKNEPIPAFWFGR